MYSLFYRWWSQIKRRRSFKRVEDCYSCAGSFSPLTFGSPNSYQSSSWRQTPFPCLGSLFRRSKAFKRLITPRCLQRLCLYGITVRSQTLCSAEWLTYCLALYRRGPVTTFDKEVSPHWRVSHQWCLISNMICTRSNISGRVSCCQLFQWTLILSDVQRRNKKFGDVSVLNFFEEIWVA